MSTKVVAICVRRRAGVGVLEGVLIDAEPRRALEPVVAVDQLVAVVDHCLMGAGPADPELTGHRCDACPAPRRHVGRSPAGPARSATPAPRSRSTSPTTSPDRTFLAAAPGPLGPHDHRRHASDRQVAHHHPTAPVADRPHPAARTPRPRCCRLHEQPVLAVMHGLRGDDEPAQADERGRARVPATTVAHVGGPPVCRCQLSAEWRGLRLASWTLSARTDHDTLGFPWNRGGFLIGVAAFSFARTLMPSGVGFVAVRRSERPVSCRLRLRRGRSAARCGEDGLVGDGWRASRSWSGDADGCRRR